MKKLYSTVILAALAVSASATTIYVDANGTGDYPTIQAAINDTNDGDEIILLPGTYTGTGNRNIDYGGKAITVRSTQPNNSQIVLNTVIDCEYDGHGFRFHSGEDVNSILAGITIIRAAIEYSLPPRYYYSQTDTATKTATSLPDYTAPFPDLPPLPPDITWPGWPNLPPYPEIPTGPIPFPYEPPASPSYLPGSTVKCLNNSNPLIISCHIYSCYGDTISCDGASPIILRCTFKSNRGMIVACEDGHLTISGCYFSQNGIAIYCDESSANISNCIITRSSNGGLFLQDSEVSVTNCIIGRNNGAGISLTVSSNARITNCTVHNNYAEYLDPDSTPGVGIDLSSSSTASINNCIIYDNQEGQIDGSGTAIVSYSDIQGGWPGVGNLNMPPLLTKNGYLMTGSPCINSANDVNVPDSDINGEFRLQGSAFDMGADEFFDTDQDGLPDWWELKYFANETAADPNDDNEPDGIINIREYELGGNPLASGLTYYVDPVNGDNNYDGLAPSWDGVHGPKRYIQSAIYTAAGINGDMIILLPGTHYGGWHETGMDFLGKWLNITSTDPNDPCVVASTIIDCEYDSYYKDRRGFWFHSSEGPESILQGITIIDGTAQEYNQQIAPYASDKYGAAILCDSSNPTIDKCVITNNNHNTITFYRCSPILRNCTITENRKEAALVLSQSNAIIENCLIAHNLNSYYNVVFYCYTSSPKIKDCDIIYNDSGGISIHGEDTFPEVSAPVITGCNISNNQGAGIDTYPAPSSTNTTLIDCRISENNLGIRLGYGESLFLKNCVLENNHYDEDHYDGGAIYAYGDLALENCIIRNNIAREKGAVLFSSGSLDMRNCLITSNRNGKRGYRDGEPLITMEGLSLRKITNCIIWGNNGIIFEETNDPNLIVTYCDIQDGWPDEGNFDADPLLTPDGHLTADSPCIDSGSDVNVPEYDIDGEPRPANLAADIGIDEFIDTDADHLPDSWEQEYFGSTTLAEPNDNPDSDLHNNVTEYEAYSSSPTDPAKIYHVDANMPDDTGDGLTWPTAKQSITAAIDLAQNSDTIIIAPGLYEGDYPNYKNNNLDPNGKAITIRSTDPNDPNIVQNTVIDVITNRCFWLDSGEPRACVIEGLTLDGGRASDFVDRETFYKSRGGAVLCEMASPTIRKCRTIGYHPEIQVGGPGSRPLIEKCIFNGPYRIRCHWSAATINDCNFYGNEGGVGISLMSDFSTVSNCRISNCEYGIRCYLDEPYYDSGPLIVNCTITNNKSAGIMSCYNKNLTVRNCAILGNGDTNILFERETGHSILENCIIAEVHPPHKKNIMILSNPSDANVVVVISHCDIVGGRDSILVYCGNLSWGPGNIDVDPHFVTPGYWDPNSTPTDANDDFWVDGDYHLKSEAWRWDTEHQRWDWDDVTSRCIDAGNPGCDPVNEPNIIDEWTAQNLRINMGAYGGTVEASMPPYDWALLCDTDNSGIVDLKDFAWLSSLWLNHDDELFADFNRDLNVDSNDSDLLAEDWLITTIWH